MARQLGTLTIDLIAKIGGFTEGMNKAERVADQKSREMERKMKERSAAVEKAWTGIGAAISAGIAGITIGSVMGKVLTETRNAEQEQALLAAALKATGNQAGFSQKRLNEMASAMEGITTKSAGEFNQAQTVLLGFTNIVGDKVPKALLQAANFSVRTGSDMKSAAETVGRALDIPSVGMASLARQGFKFSESQIEAAQKLEQTGKIAEAQDLILKSLEETYGGAAVGARDTFGGAIDSLRNTINGLLTGGNGSLDQAKNSINDLTRTLGSDTTRAGFDAIVGWVVALTNSVIKAAANIVAFMNTANKLGAITGNDGFGKMKAEAQGASAEVARLTDTMERHQEALKRDPTNVILQRSVTNTRRLIDAAQKRAGVASDALKQWADGSSAQVKVDPIVLPDMAVKKLGPVNLKDGSGNSKGSAPKVDKEAHAAAQFLKTLGEQAFKVQEKTAYEKLFFDIQNKGLKLSDQQLAKASGLATLIDMAKEKEQERAANLERQNLLYEMQERLLSKNQQYQLLLMQYGMGDQSAENLRERVALLQQQQAEIRKLYQDRTLAIAAAKDADDADVVRDQYAERLRIVQQAQRDELDMFDDFIAQKKLKERDWLLGAESALRTYQEQSANVYGQTKQIATTTLQGVEQGFVDLAMKGSFSFKDLANNVIAEILRVQVRAAMAGIFGNLFGGSLLGSLGGGSSGGFFSNLFGGGRATGGPVSAGKMYQVNERGTPELLNVGGKQLLMMAGQSGSVAPITAASAAVPAAVAAQASGSMGGVHVDVKVNVESSGAGNATATATGGNASLMAEFGKGIGNLVNEHIARAQRPGGLLWKAQQGGRA